MLIIISGFHVGCDVHFVTPKDSSPVNIAATTAGRWLGFMRMRILIWLITSIQILGMQHHTGERSMAFTQYCIATCAGSWMYPGRSKLLLTCHTEQ